MDMLSGINKKNSQRSGFCGLGLTSGSYYLQLMGYHSVSGGGIRRQTLFFFPCLYHFYVKTLLKHTKNITPTKEINVINNNVLQPPYKGKLVSRSTNNQHCRH